MRLAWSTLFWAWALGGLALVGALQLAFGWRDRLRERRARSKRLFCCADCGCVYLGGDDAPARGCPRCGRQNVQPQ